MWTFQRLWAAAKTIPPRKIVGVLFMAGGGVPLALFLLLIPLLLLGDARDDISPLVTIATIVSLFLIGAVRLFCAKRRRLRTSIVLIILTSLSALAYYRFGTAEGILARYGVYYNPDAEGYASPNLNKVAFWFEGPNGKLQGPEIVGDNLVVGKPYRSKEGRLEFQVQSPEGNEHCRIQLISPPEGEVAFHIVDPGVRTVSMYYPLQKEVQGWP